MTSAVLSRVSRFGRQLGPNALIIAILAIVIFFAIAQPAFLKPENLIGILRQVSLIGIMAACMTFVIMTGGVDLSVGRCSRSPASSPTTPCRRACRCPSCSLLASPRAR